MTAYCQLCFTSRYFPHYRGFCLADRQCHCGGKYRRAVWNDEREEYLGRRGEPLTFDKTTTRYSGSPV